MGWLIRAALLPLVIGAVMLIAFPVYIVWIVPQPPPETIVFSTEPSPEPSTARRLVVTLASGRHLDCYVAGDPSNPLVVLLHGFPESAELAWRQVLALAEGHFYLVAPDLPGYNRSSPPPSYGIDVLADEIAALIRALQGGGEKEGVNLVAHDWGGAIAWTLAQHHAPLIRRLIVTNAPYESAYHEVMTRSWESGWLQLRKSYYMLAFQYPWIPEYHLSNTNFRAMQNGIFRDSTHRASFNAVDRPHYLTLWRTSLTQMLAYYRGILRSPSPLPNKIVEVPTRILWGAKDVALDPALATLSAKYCANASVRLFPNASHWLPHDEPAAMVEEMKEFFSP